LCSRTGSARFTLDRVFVPGAASHASELYAWPCRGSSLWVAAHHGAATTETPRRHNGAGGGEKLRAFKAGAASA
jgi:hypothetical protein